MPFASDPHVRLLLAALRAWIAAPAPDDGAVPLDWDLFLKLAQDTKTIGFMEKGLEKLAVKVPASVQQRLAEVRERILQ